MKFKLVLLLSTVFMLQGCAALFVGSAAVATKTATDPRTVGEQIDDLNLRKKIAIEINKQEEWKRVARIVFSTYQGDVLLMGQSPTTEIKTSAENLVKKIAGVESVYNEIRISNKVGLSTLSNDSWITTQVRSKLLADKDIPSRNIKVVTENGEVFLLGFLTKLEATKAANLAGTVNGVKLVTKLIHYVD